MKKLVFFILIFGFLFSTVNLFADETIDAVSGEADKLEEEKSEEVESEEDEESELQKRKDTLAFGLESEITDLISKLLKEEDKSLSDDILAIFNSTKNVNVREKAIEYFTKIEDTCLKDYALLILEDPYDEKTSSVNLLFKYVTALKITEAAPLIQELLDSENEEYYDAANILVIPSICYDNSPLVIYESFSRSTPVIGSNIGGIPELIQDGFNGYLFEAENPYDLKDKLLKVINNKDKLKILEENAYNSINDESINDMTENIINEYEKILRK